MRANTDWFQQAGWGVFTHYLAPADMPAEVWQAQVDAFDVEALAEQLVAAGAPYYLHHHRAELRPLLRAQRGL